MFLFLKLDYYNNLITNRDVPIEYSEYYLVI